MPNLLSTLLSLLSSNISISIDIVIIQFKHF